MLSSGVSVSFSPKVPTDRTGWTNTPYEAQYLKLYDVTPPAIPRCAHDNELLCNRRQRGFQLVSAERSGRRCGWLSGSWSGHPGHCQCFQRLRPSAPTLTVTNVYGATLYAEVSAVNNAGIPGPASASSIGVTLIAPNWIPLLSMQGNSVLSLDQCFRTDVSSLVHYQSGRFVHDAWRGGYSFRGNNPKHQSLCRSGKILPRPSFPMVKISQFNTRFDRLQKQQ